MKENDIVLTLTPEQLKYSIEVMARNERLSIVTLSTIVTMLIAMALLLYHFIGDIIIIYSLLAPTVVCLAILFIIPRILREKKMMYEEVLEARENEEYEEN